MDWQQEAENEGSSNNLPEGWHRVVCKKVIRSKQDGTELATKAGPMMIVVFEGEGGRQATCSYWLTAKAAWKLARDMSILGVDLARLNADGVETDSFLDGQFGQNLLEGRHAWGKVEHDGKYANIELAKEEEVPARALKEHAQTEGQPEPVGASSSEPEPDDIPF
jgi:hypothetical protein